MTTVKASSHPTQLHISLQSIQLYQQNSNSLLVGYCKPCMVSYGKVSSSVPDEDSIVALPLQAGTEDSS